MPVKKETGESPEPGQGPLRAQARGLRERWERRIAQAERPDLDAEARLAGEFRSDMNVDGLRAVFASVTALLNARLPPLGRLVAGVSIGDDTPATVDLQVPAGAGPHPVVVYLHGGVWVAGSPASHRKLTARIAENGYLVVSVDYRLAPEHPFPAALDDCIAAVYWAAANAARYDGDPARLAIAGDSAGANLAAATAGVLSARLAAPKIGAALLIYGVFDLRDLGNPRASEFVHRAYLPGERRELLLEPRVSPIRWAHRLPPSFVVVGTRDSLLGQSRQLRDALVAAGTPHVYLEERNMPHGFMQMEFMGAARGVVRKMTEFLDVHIAETRMTRWRGLWMRGSLRLREETDRMTWRRALRGASRWTFAVAKARKRSS